MEMPPTPAPTTRIRSDRFGAGWTWCRLWGRIEPTAQFMSGPGPLYRFVRYRPTGVAPLSRDDHHRARETQRRARIVECHLNGLAEFRQILRTSAEVEPTAADPHPSEHHGVPASNISHLRDQVTDHLRESGETVLTRIDFAKQADEIEPRTVQDRGHHVDSARTEDDPLPPVPHGAGNQQVNLLDTVGHHPPHPEIGATEHQFVSAEPVGMHHQSHRMDARPDRGRQVPAAAHLDDQPVIAGPFRPRC